VIAAAGCLLVLPWAFVTAIETDSGWEDAVWTSGTSRFAAVGLTAAGGAAALTALVAAIRYREEARGASLRLLGGALAAEVLLAVAWVVLAYTA
jgi:hypothetical protein